MKILEIITKQFGRKDFNIKQIFYILPIILLVIVLVPSEASAKSYGDETTRYDTKMFGIVSGTYDTKNGMINLSGMYKYGNSNLSDIRILGQLKYWDMIDTSIPNCYHAFSDNMRVLFDKNRSYGELKVIGKKCSASSNNSWETIRVNFIIEEGETPSSDGMNGKGIITLTINTKNGKTFGTIQGNIILYT